MLDLIYAALHEFSDSDDTRAMLAAFAEGLPSLRLEGDEGERAQVCRTLEALGRASANRHLPNDSDWALLDAALPALSDMALAATLDPSPHVREQALGAVAELVAVLDRALHDPTITNRVACSSTSRGTDHAGAPGGVDDAPFFKRFPLPL